VCMFPVSRMRLALVTRYPFLAFAENKVKRCVSCVVCEKNEAKTNLW
jgi:hypothetical protein